MVNAFVLVNIAEKKVRQIANNLLEVNGVTEVYPVAGEYDFLVVVRVESNEKVAEIIEEILHHNGVRHTKTLFALEAFSKVDLAKAFGLT